MCEWPAVKGSGRSGRAPFVISIRGMFRPIAKIGLISAEPWKLRASMCSS